MNKIFVTCDIGVNHNGNYNEAKKLMEYALYYGADAVKFQYWSKNLFPEIEHLRLNKNQLYDLKSCFEEECNNLNNKEFFCSAFDIESFNFVSNNLDCDIYKIPSNKTVFENEELLDLIIERAEDENDHSKLFVSTGLYNKAKELIYNKIQKKNIDLTVFHCISEYPTSLEKINIKRLINLKDELWFRVGFSDHSGLIEIPIIAVSLGAEAIEVHVTVDKNQDGPDHKASLNLEEFKTMVKMIRNIEKVL